MTRASLLRLLLGCAHGELLNRLSEESERGRILSAELGGFVEATPTLVEQNDAILEQLRGIGYVG